MSYIHKDSIYSICIACFLCINRNKENMRNQFIHFNVSMIMLLTPFCSKQRKWFNYGKCFLWSYKSWFSVSCTFKIKNLINKKCKCSHLRITCNNRLQYCVFCLTLHILHMIKFYHSIDIIFNISSMYNNMKIKLHNTTRASEQLVRDPIGGVSLNIIPYVKIVIHVG